MTSAPAPLVYLHGLPGGPGEIALVAARPDHFFAPLVADGPLAPHLNRRFGHHRVALVGFSLGAFRALRFAAAHPDRIAALHLIAPAPPLDLGDFLGLMAGAPIFRLARDHPRLFRIVTALQSRLARWAPDGFARQIFAEAGGEDAQLAASPLFCRTWSALAHEAMRGAAGKAYADEISAYVQPWASLLAGVSAPVTIYSGAADTWVPAMGVEALAAALPCPPKHICFPKGGHYSTLAAALPLIVAQRDQSAFS